MMDEQTTIPIHQWTNGGDRVFLIKCLNRDGTTHDGFIWPQFGEVVPKHWGRDATCESGGLFGWPWGLHIGDGRDPDAIADWIVFSAKAENVIWLDPAKAKTVPGDDGDQTQVIYRGTLAGAMKCCEAGRIAWIERHSRGAASSTGYRGAASSTGDGGAASSTGDGGAASSTGYSGAAVVTGNYSTVECGPTGICACTQPHVVWRVRHGALLLQRWDGGHALLIGSDYDDGALLMIERGKIVTEWSD